MEPLTKQKSRVWVFGRLVLLLSGGLVTLILLRTSISQSHLIDQGRSGAEEDISASVWDLQSGTRAQTFRGHNRPVTAIAYSPEGTRILTGSITSELRMWDTQTGTQIKEFDLPGDSVTALGFSSDGKSFFVGGRHGTLHLCNSETGEIIQKFYGRHGGVKVAFQAPNDQKLFVAYESGPTVTEWDIATVTETRTFREVREGVRVAWAVDGKTRSWWSTESGSQVPGEFEARVSSLTSTRKANINISPDCKRAFTWSVEGGMASVPSFQGIVSDWARLWDMGTGELIWFSKELPLGALIAFTPDSTQFVTASIEGGMKVWSATNGAEIRTLGSGQEPFDQIGFSLDGKTLLTWTDRTVPRSNEWEGVAHLWNVETGEVIRSLAIPVMTCVAFSPDGTKIAVGEYGEFRGN